MLKEITNIKTSIINVELYVIYILQKYLNSDYIFTIINYNKYLTSIISIRLYLIFIFYYDMYLCLYIIYTLYISRKTNYYIKNYFKKERPYNRNPEYITYYKKRKYSYSFPSQSILNICVIYNTICYYNNYNSYHYEQYIWFQFINYMYYILFISLSITRMYRGLHYPHDIIISYIYGIFIVNLLLCII